jgi:CDP-paratose 2-epimerase
VEDQGWVAWFVIAAILKKPISIFGTGHQVRDLLHVDDLVALYQLIAQDQSIPAGAYNVGGGPTSTMSLLELVDVLNASGLDVDPTYDAVRPGDQPIFVSDISRIANAAGWNPKKAVEDGVRELTEWVDVHKGLISDVLGETV